MHKSKHFPPWEFDEPNPEGERKFKVKMAKELKKNGSPFYWHPRASRMCYNCKTSLVLCTGDGYCMCENCGDDCGFE